MTGKPLNKGKQMTDYSTHLLKIKQFRNKAHTALQEHRWADACDLADKIVVEAKLMKLYCTDQLEKPNADQPERP
jgi:hypothetical protein